MIRHRSDYLQALRARIQGASTEPWKCQLCGGKDLDYEEVARDFKAGTLHGVAIGRHHGQEQVEVFPMPSNELDDDAIVREVRRLTQGVKWFDPKEMVGQVTPANDVLEETG